MCQHEANPITPVCVRFRINPKQTVSLLKTGLSATNMNVRQSCIHLAGVLYLYMGTTLRTMLSDEKPAMLAMLEEEWAKLGDSRPPPPTRGLKLIKKAPADAASASGATAEEAPPEPDDLVDRTDIRWVNASILLPPPPTHLTPLPPGDYYRDQSSLR